MLAPAANHLIGGKKKTRWMLSESGRSRENVCLLPGQKECIQAGRFSKQKEERRGEERRGEERR